MSDISDKLHKLDYQVIEMNLRLKNLDKAANSQRGLLSRLLVLGATYLVSIPLFLALQVQNALAYALIPALPVAVELIVELILRRRNKK
jgi:hypothetical protein